MHEVLVNRFGGLSLSPDPFFASLFSFLFVRDTNLAHPIKIVHFTPLSEKKGSFLFSHRNKLGLKRHMKKKCKNARYM